MTEKELEKVYLSRPFKTRNADEYDLENVLDLFIDNTDNSMFQVNCLRKRNTRAIEIEKSSLC